MDDVHLDDHGRDVDGVVHLVPLGEELHSVKTTWKTSRHIRHTSSASKRKRLQKMETLASLSSAVCCSEESLCQKALIKR